MKLEPCSSSSSSSSSSVGFPADPPVAADQLSAGPWGGGLDPDSEVGRCRLTPGLTPLNRAWFQRLKQEYDEPLSNFVFNFNMRRYSEVDECAAHVCYGCYCQKMGYTAYFKNRDGLGEFCSEYWDNEKLRAGMLVAALLVSSVMNVVITFVVIFLTKHVERAHSITFQAGGVLRTSTRPTLNLTPPCTI